MVRRADAPRPGWYPDPSGRTGLLWWDGRDWTHHRRPLPAAHYHAEVDEPVGAGPSHAGSTGAGAPAPGDVPTAAQIRARGTEAAAVSRRADQEVTDAVAAARRVARSEVERAVTQATSQLERTRSAWEPRVQASLRRAKRWARIAAAVVVVYVVLTAWASATLQVGLLEWLGERVDAVTAVVLTGDAGTAPPAR